MGAAIATRFWSFLGHLCFRLRVAWRAAVWDGAYLPAAAQIVRTSDARVVRSSLLPFFAPPRIAPGPDGSGFVWSQGTYPMKALVFALAALVAGPAAAAPLCTDLGLAGLLARCNRGETVALTLASGKPLFEGSGPIELQSGAYYQIEITADGSAELAVAGPEFFRAIWMNEIVINDIEVRPMAIDSIEFDAAGSARLSFIAIKPGTFDLHVPGSTGETQRVQFAIR